MTHILAQLFTQKLLSTQVTYVWTSTIWVYPYEGLVIELLWTQRRATCVSVLFSNRGEIKDDQYKRNGAASSN